MDVPTFVVGSIAAFFSALVWWNSRPQFLLKAKVVQAKRQRVNRMNGRLMTVIGFQVDMIARNRSYEIERAKYEEIDEQGGVRRSLDLDRATEDNISFTIPRVLHRSTHWPSRPRTMRRYYDRRPHVGRVIVQTGRGKCYTAKLDLGSHFDSCNLPEGKRTIKVNAEIGRIYPATTSIFMFVSVVVRHLARCSDTRSPSIHQTARRSAPWRHLDPS